LEASVNDQGSYWQFEEVEGGNRLLKVVLEKRQGAAHWVRWLARLAPAAQLTPVSRRRSTCWTRT